MNSVNLFLWFFAVASGLLAYGASQARAAPAFAFANAKCSKPKKSRKTRTSTSVMNLLAIGTGWNFEVGRALCPPPYEMLQLASRRPRVSHKEHVRLQASNKIVMQDDDVDGGTQCARTTPSYRARVRIYDELVKTFEGVASAERARLLKMGLRSSLPPTHRELVERAYAEVYQTT